MTFEEKLARMNKYIKKQQLLGDNFLEFETLKEINFVGVYKGNSQRWLSNKGINLIIPSFVNSILSNSFDENNNIKSISFEKGSEISVIGIRAFEKCKKLEYIDFSNCTADIDIEEGAFCWCTNLKDLTFNKRIGYYIGRYAFNNTKIQSIDMKCDEIELDTCAFSECKELKKVRLKADIITVDKEVFKHCNNLNKENIHLEYK